MKRLIIPAFAIAAAALMFKSKFESRTDNASRGYKLPAFSVSLKKQKSQKSDRGAARASSNTKAANASGGVAASGKGAASASQASGASRSPAIDHDQIDALSRNISEEIMKVERAWERIRDKAYDRMGLTRAQQQQLAEARYEFLNKRDKITAETGSMDEQTRWHALALNTSRFEARIQQAVGQQNFQFLIEARDEFNKRISNRTQHGITIGEGW